MPKAEKKSLSRKYLKILGIVTIVFSLLITILAAIVIFSGQVKLDDLIGAADLAKLRESASDDTIRTTVGVVVIISGLIGLLLGWLLCRAAKDPNKSTFALVLVVLSVVSGLVTVISGEKNASTLITNILSLTISVLALMALVNVRKERTA